MIWHLLHPRTRKARLRQVYDKLQLAVTLALKSTDPEERLV